MARISGVAARAQKELDIARTETKSLTNVVSGLPGEAGCAGSPVGASAATTHPRSLARRTTAGDPDQVQADPTPPAEPPGGGPSASAPSLTAPSHHSAGRRNERVPPGQWQ